ncbi:hypothetical protein HIM_10447 [Hirsutella minnesotensis 3608]|uniref:Uncharacterized protein n=1 Tax=Hirsutella minnesotensis 3608 TaxID=1043627 RepID=A0A0F7ZRT3_9HYPO|nr:hypothetical protein HIM_10447 [Hirsutella minnesotensis 3608]
MTNPVDGSDPFSENPDSCFGSGVADLWGRVPGDKCASSDSGLFSMNDPFNFSDCNFDDDFLQATSGLYPNATNNSLDFADGQTETEVEPDFTLQPTIDSLAHNGFDPSSHLLEYQPHQVLPSQVQQDIGGHDASIEAYYPVVNSLFTAVDPSVPLSALNAQQNTGSQPMTTQQNRTQWPTTAEQAASSHVQALAAAVQGTSSSWRAQTPTSEHARVQQQGNLQISANVANPHFPTPSLPSSLLTSKLSLANSCDFHLHSAPSHSPQANAYLQQAATMSLGSQNDPSAVLAPENAMASLPLYQDYLNKASRGVKARQQKQKRLPKTDSTAYSHSQGRQTLEQHTLHTQALFHQLEPQNPVLSQLGTHSFDVQDTAQIQGQPSDPSYKAIPNGNALQPSSDLASPSAKIFPVSGPGYFSPQYDQPASSLAGGPYSYYPHPDVAQQSVPPYGNLKDVSSPQESNETPESILGKRPPARRAGGRRITGTRPRPNNDISITDPNLIFLTRKNELRIFLEKVARFEASRESPNFNRRFEKVNSSREAKARGDPDTNPAMVYEPHPQLPSWGEPTDEDEADPLFAYLPTGQLKPNFNFSAKALRQFVRQSRCRIWLQSMPAQEARRMTREDKCCRWKHCPVPNRTIGPGWFRVAFDHFPNMKAQGRLDPIKYVLVMHLWCFEQIFDIMELVRNGQLVVDARVFQRESRNVMHLDRSGTGIIKEAFLPWVECHNHDGILLVPREHKFTLSYSLVTGLVEGQTGARQNTRTMRNDKRPENIRKTVDYHQGNLLLYVERERAAKEYKDNLKLLESQQGDSQPATEKSKTGKKSGAGTTDETTTTAEDEDEPEPVQEKTAPELGGGPQQESAETETVAGTEKSCDKSCDDTPGGQETGKYDLCQLNGDQGAASTTTGNTMAEWVERQVSGHIQAQANSTQPAKQCLKRRRSEEEDEQMARPAKVQVDFFDPLSLTNSSCIAPSKLQKSTASESNESLTPKRKRGADEDSGERAAKVQHLDDVQELKRKRDDAEADDEDARILNSKRAKTDQDEPNCPVQDDVENDAEILSSHDAARDGEVEEPSVASEEKPADFPTFGTPIPDLFPNISCPAEWDLFADFAVSPTLGQDETEGPQ